MQRNLKFKAAIIVAIILICIYGVIGLPKSKDELVANWHKNIRLGLDLKGGTHLVMQVQVQDAFKASRRYGRRPHEGRIQEAVHRFFLH